MVARARSPISRELVNDFRANAARLPNPVPAGEDPKQYFAHAYAKLADHLKVYGWFQLQVVILAYDEQPLTFRQALDGLTAENYGR